MKEYIEREAIKAAVRKRLTNSLIIGWLIRIIDAIPAADVAPVVHGRWVRTKDGDWECTNCKETVVICVCGKDVTAKKTICPNCGARMDGDGSD